MSATVLKLKASEASESYADKVRRLQEEAQAQALHHTRAFEQAICDLEQVASEIAEGGEAYPVGVRAAARRLGVELAGARLNVASLLGRKA